MTTIAMCFTYLYAVIGLAVMGFLAVHFFKAKNTKKIVVAGLVITIAVAIGIYPIYKQGIVFQNWIGYLLCAMISVLIGSVVGLIIGFIIAKLRKVTLLGIGATSGIFAGCGCIFIGVTHLLGIIAIFSTFVSIVFCIGGVLFLAVGISMAKDEHKKKAIERNRN